MNFYNEYDPKAAAWIQELINQKLIPDGIVDERSIADVTPDDLRGFTQCHFFAGIGGWPLALRLAGVDPNEPLWTGSCPCQPFSTAGKRGGVNDERHLWPVFFNLIKECRPAKVFGEQVANAIKFGWLDRVYADLESAGYAVGSAVIGAHSVNAPHQRQRLYWGCEIGSLADTKSTRELRGSGAVCETNGGQELDTMREFGGASGVLCGLPNALREQADGTHSPGLHAGTAGNSTVMRISNSTGRQREQPIRTQGNELQRSADYLPDSRMAEITESIGRRGWSDELPIGMQRQVQTPGLGACGGITAVAQGDGCGERLQGRAGNGDDRNEPGRHGEDTARPVTATGGNDNLPSIPWSRYALIYCRDNKVRRVPAESVLFSVVDGVSGGMDISRADRGFPLCKTALFEKGQIAVLLKGYGNAINPYTAAAFIKAFNHREGK